VRTRLYLGRIGGEKLGQEWLGARVSYGRRLRVLTGPNPPQYASGQRQRIGMPVRDRVLPLEHRDQQGGVGRLAGENDADAAGRIARSPRQQLKQIAGGRLAGEFALDLCGDLSQPRAAAAVSVVKADRGIIEEPGNGILSFLGRVASLQGLLPDS